MTRVKIGGRLCDVAFGVAAALATVSLGFHLGHRQWTAAAPDGFMLMIQAVCWFALQHMNALFDAQVRKWIADAEMSELMLATTRRAIETGQPLDVVVTGGRSH